MIFYDTNALIFLKQEAFKEKFYISDVTLIELEHIKTSRSKDESVKCSVRQVVKELDQKSDTYNVIIYNNEVKQLLIDKGLDETPDNKICACAAYAAKNNEVIFVTGDICCKLIAKNVFGLEVHTTFNSESRIYTGYKEITGNTEKINYVMANLDFSDWYANEYLLINNTEDGTTKEMRFDGNRFVALKLPPSKYIKGKNALQRCALDMLLNPDITICAVLGGYGSGKTMLSTKMALYQVIEKGNQAKIDIVREPKGEGDSVGYLKGDFETKTDQFFLPVAQQLDGGEYELEMLKQRGVIEAHIPYYCKGLTFSESIVLIDEAEDLSEKQIKLIGTRVGNNSRIFLNGDYKQSVIQSDTENALIKMCNSLKGNPMFATIYLGEDVRSATSKIFAHVFEQ